MPDYSKLWAGLAERAVATGGVDLTAFLRQATDSGMSTEEVERRVMDDLDNDGPLFGKFLRNLKGGAKSSIAEATRQGEFVGHVSADKELKQLLNLADADDVIGDVMDNADPAAVAALEAELGDAMPYTSIAEMRNTCNICLPMHGKTMAYGEWMRLGMLPSTRHPSSWLSRCHCRLVPSSVAEGRDDLVAPLLRIKEKGIKRTARAVTQQSLARAQAAVAKASESEEGRRMLRILGGGQAPRMAAPPRRQSQAKRSTIQPRPPEGERSGVTVGVPRTGQRVELSKVQADYRAASDALASPAARAAATTTDRQKRLQWQWVHGSARKSSVALKQAAAAEFDLGGTVYNPRGFAVSPADVARTRKDVRSMYERTQAHYKSKGTTSVTVYRGIKGNQGGSNSVESWTTDVDVARNFGDNVIKRTVPVDRILTARDVPGWSDGIWGNQGEVVIIN